MISSWFKHAALAAAACGLLAACGEGGAAPPGSEDPAVGLVPEENAGGAVNPITPSGQFGGPAGQTPDYGEPGGQPGMVVQTAPEPAPPAIGSGNPPLSAEGRRPEE